MFKLVKERLVWWPVRVTIPTDGGDVEEQSFSLKFRVRDVDGNRELLASAPAMAPSGTADKPQLSESYADFVLQLATDWKDVAEEGAKDQLPFSRANLIDAMKVPGAFMAVLEAYRSCSLGEKATRAGN